MHTIVLKKQMNTIECQLSIELSTSAVQMQRADSLLRKSESKQSCQLNKN